MSESCDTCGGGLGVAMQGRKPTGEPGGIEDADGNKHCSDCVYSGEV